MQKFYEHIKNYNFCNNCPCNRLWMVEKNCELIWKWQRTSHSLSCKIVLVELLAFYIIVELLGIRTCAILDHSQIDVKEKKIILTIKNLFYLL